MGSSRQVLHGQKIHTSLVLASGNFADKYNPTARPPVDNKDFWKQLRAGKVINPNDGTLHQWLELGNLSSDSYEYIKKTADDPNDVALHQLRRQMASTSAYTSSCAIL